MVKTSLINPGALWPMHSMAPAATHPAAEKAAGSVKKKYPKTERYKHLRRERLRAERNERVMNDPTIALRRVALADLVAIRSRIPITQANDILRVAFEIIFEKLATGGRVNCTPLGTFETSTRKVGAHRHVKTGERIEVESFYRAASFRGSLSLRAAVNKGRK